MKTRTSQTIFAYWNEVRRGRIAPRRFDIEPARIAGILAETLILEHLDRHTYRFRLAGSRIIDHIGRELRGANFLDLWPAEDRTRIVPLIEQIADQGGACRIAFRAIAADGEAAELEAMLMPLVHTHGEVDRFLGSISVITAPSWLGDASIVGFALDYAEVIWPDGKPGALTSAAGMQAPLIALASSGRIVKSQRRQFRVFDGGRQDNDRSER